jgi:hypothetical protein
MGAHVGTQTRLHTDAGLPVHARVCLGYVAALAPPHHLSWLCGVESVVWSRHRC